MRQAYLDLSGLTPRVNVVLAGQHRARH